MKNSEFSMKITEKELIDGIVALYVYYFNQCRELGRDSEAPDYYAAVGASNAIGAIALQVLGGKQMFELWKALTDMSVDEDPEA